MKNQMTIHSDTFYISERLKEIDKSYYLVFNFNSAKFELHSSEQKGGTYCLTLPFNVLDERTIDYVKKTRAGNIDNLIEEMDKENEKVYSSQVKDAVNGLKEVIL